MRVWFIGCPCSGKTTTAAMLFAALKEIGMECEFLPEQARLYIANLRYQLQIRGIPDNQLVLEDDDQMTIMEKQIHVDEIVGSVVAKDTIVISDSSPFNSLLYMSSDAHENLIVQKLIEKAILNSDLVFYLPPVPRSESLDANRIHTEEQSIKIDKTIPSLLKKLAPSVWETMIPVDGEPSARLSQVVAKILEHRSR